MPAACEQERILSVTELTDRMRRTLEGTFPFVWVRGEIGELSFPGSGHIYFTLCSRFFCRGAQTSAACQSQPRGAGDVTCRGCHP